MQIITPRPPRRTSTAADPATLARFDALLRAVDVVSFDLFDTLIHREGLFAPKDLFVQVQAEGERRLGRPLPQFGELRVRAEERARVQARRHGSHEVSLDAIYAELSRLLRLPAASLAALQQIELGCERAALTALDSGRRLFVAALAAGKRVVIITDTYFDEAFIGEVVREAGYGAAERVFVSSAFGKTKLDGSLYDVALRELGCAPGRVLHVGDNQLVDATMALGRGLRSFYMPTLKHRFRWRHGLGDGPSGNLVMSRMLFDLSRQPLDSSGELRAVLEQTATHNLSRRFFGFATWLLERLREGGYRRVYFAARDGLIMKQFFDLVAGAAGFAIDSRYLYVSRQALYPSMIFVDPAEARRLFAQHWDHLTIEDALGRIGLRFDDCRAALARYGFHDPRARLDGDTAPAFGAFLQQIWPQIERQNAEQYRATVDYLQQEGLLDDEKAAFVDIGWHGSLQNCLLKLLGHLGVAKQLGGFYLGTFQQPAGAVADFHAEGYLVNQGQPDAIRELVRFGPSLLELFHSAGHGTVMGYSRGGAQIEPLLQENFEERWQYHTTIEPLQRRAFSFVAEHLARQPGVPLAPPSPELVARAALRVIYAPTPAEAAVFGGLRIASDFGGRLKSITGMTEWDLRQVKGELLPDSTVPIWRPGFHVLKLHAERAAT